MSNASRRKAAIQEWIDSSYFDPFEEPEKSFEKTRVFHRTPDDLLDGVEMQELDFELDTMPAELLDLFPPEKKE